MLTRISLMLCVVCAMVLLLAACGTTVTENHNRPASPPTQASPASTATTTTTTTAPSGDSIGVADCDSFIAAYDACVSSKVPEVARAQYKTAIEQWRTSWRQLAANPNTKATLAGVCKQAAEQANVSMKSFNCTF